MEVIHSFIQIILFDICFFHLSPGTNDLGHGKDGGTLLKAICELHDVAKSFGAHTAAVSIPQFGLEMVCIYVCMLVCTYACVYVCVYV